MRLRYTLLVLYVLAIFVAAVFPVKQAGITGLNHTYVMSFRLDHLLHLLIFLPLYPLLEISFRPQNIRSRLGLLLVGLVLAMAAEFVQQFVDYRSYNPMDLLANAAGVLLGITVWSMVRLIRKSLP